MVVVVVPEELELLDESSFFAQEMMVRLKNVDRKMKIILFIIQLITKVEYFSLGEPYKYHNFKDFTRMRGFYWREFLVSVWCLFHTQTASFLLRHLTTQT